MRHIVAILAVVALLFSAGSSLADDTGEANELFVGAVKLVKSTLNVEGLEEKADALEEALAKLNEIVDDYPSSELAVKLISGQRIGAISLEGVSLEARRAKRAAEEAQAFDLTLKAAEQGDAEAQYKVGGMYAEGEGTPWNYAKASEWYYRVAIQGHEYAKIWSEAESGRELAEVKIWLETELGLELPEVIPEAREVD